MPRGFSDNVDSKLRLGFRTFVKHEQRHAEIVKGFEKSGGRASWLLAAGTEIQTQRRGAKIALFADRDGADQKKLARTSLKLQYCELSGDYTTLECARWRQ